MKLYRATGEKRYLKLAQYFIDHRGQKPSFFEKEYQLLDPNFRTPFLGRTIGLRTLYDEFFRKDPDKFDTQYSQDHLSVRQQDKVVGHAVRAMYLYSGMADVAAETHDSGLFDALLNLYRDLTSKRLYITGGIGPSAENEGFTRDYDLPNETAYQETCASIGVAMWAQRMLALTGNGHYADLMEQSLYNGFLAGVSLDGDTFFYDNPLYSRGGVSRKTWFTVPCCPTNVARIMPSIGKYIYSQSGDGLWVNLYVQSRVTLPPSGATEGISLTQTTEFPWEGRTKLSITKAPAVDYTLFLRVPRWAGRADMKLNGRALNSEPKKGYVAIRRRWRSGDTLEVAFPTDVLQLEANPSVTENRGRVALRRGPLMYCLEQPDNKTDIDQISLAQTTRFTSEYNPNLLNGITVLSAVATQKAGPGWGDQLYRPVGAPTSVGSVPIRAVPYCVWANRGAHKMAVWIDALR